MKNKCKQLSLCLLLLFWSGYAQAQKLEWAKSVGGASNDSGRSTATDAAGNVYTTGQFGGTADFDPSAGVFNLTPAGGSDIFVSKLDAAGNFIWAKRMGGTGPDGGNSIVLDASGNIYTTGFFSGTADFDPSAGVFNLTAVVGGSVDIFVSKLDVAGNFVWAKSMGGASFDQGRSIAVDATGNVYTTGDFQVIVDFDPNAGVSNLTSAGSGDIFVSKLDVNGNFVWAKNMGGTGFDAGSSIVINATGNFYITGQFTGTADFDPNAGVSNLVSAGSDDIFVSKLDVNGNFVWAKGMGSTNSDQGRSIAVDASGNIYTTGFFSGTVDFDPNATVFNLTSVGSVDTFVSKLDVNGNFVWAKNMGGTGFDTARSIAVDAANNVYTMGNFEGVADFDPNAGTSNLISTGLNDIFVSKLDVNGNFAWAKNMGGASQEFGFSLALDATGNVYTTGDFQGVADFDPNAGISNLTSTGANDIFISKLDNTGNFVWAKSVGGAGSSSDNALGNAVDAAGNVYTTGTFGGTADFDPSAGVFNLSSFGGSDIFVSKLDAAGNFVWAKRIGGAGTDWGNSIAVDAAGNIYTTGFFSGTADFDPNAAVFNLTPIGGSDIFVSKLDAAGNFVWAKSMGGTGGEQGLSIAVDASNNVYTTGFFSGTADFDPNAGTSNLTSAGNTDIFVSKLDAAGNFVWAKSMGGASGDKGSSVVVDATGNVYTTGDFQGSTDFDPNAGISNLTSAGNTDIFVSKLDATGNFVWAKSMGGTSFEEGRSVVVDATGNVYTTGDFQGTGDFDPNAGAFSLTSVGSSDIFVSKLDVNGNFVWAKKMGSAEFDAGISLAVDATGNVYTTGFFQNTVDFDPNAGVFNLTSIESSAVFVSKLDAAGNFIWAKEMGGGPEGSSGYALALDAAGNIYIGGYFSGTGDFDPNAGVFNLTSTGSRDILILKLSPCSVASISPASLPAGTLGTFYNTTVTQTGFSGALTWAVSSGSLPAGLLLNAITGVISGTPTALGTTNITISVTNSVGCTQIKVYANILGCPAITFTGSGGSYSSAEAGGTYFFGNGATSVSPALITYSVSPALPAGLSLSPAGVISGTPTVVTPQTTYVVTASQGACSVTQSYTFAISPDATAPLISYAPLANTCTAGARTFLANITDGSGVPTTYH